MRRRNNTVNPAEILPGCRRGEPRRRQKRCYFRSLPLPGLDQDPAAGNDQRGRRSGDRAIGGQSVRAAIERIEQVSKQAAAGATQGSAAAEQLTAQAGGLRDVVATLEKMVEVPRRPAATR